MKAIIRTKGGPPEVLQLQNVPKPTPDSNELLVRVHAATVTQGDAGLRSLSAVMWIPMRLFIGVKNTKIPGTEFAGEIESVGGGVTAFQVGDQIFGTTTGLGAGAYAEYLCVPEDGVVAPKPGNVTYEEAAALPVGGYTALYFLRKGNIRSGQRVLIYGASGSVGTYAVQLAKHLGATVTGVCSTRNLDMVRSLGADEVIDYTKQDFSEMGNQYDIVFDAVGKASVASCKGSLAPGGAYVSVTKGLAKESAADLAYLAELVEAGELRPVIDRRYPLEQIAEAHAYVETGRKRGNVIIAVTGASE
jgi:NADPH:quinone reductase-like Zn-dependent oxidoreductase